jgi:hypothetical protein
MSAALANLKSSPHGKAITQQHLKEIMKILQYQLKLKTLRHIIKMDY